MFPSPPIRSLQYRHLTMLIVQKYGGTSVGDPGRIRNVAARILRTQSEGHQVVAVVSAMSGVTNNLERLAREVCPQPSRREMDVLLATGEQTTIALTAMAIQGLGGRAVSLTGAQAGIATDGDHTRARITTISPQGVHRMLDDGQIVILAGFQGQSSEGLITTLGRGGSDLTAIAMAAAIKADLCQIYTDVDGVFTCDPRIVPEASLIREISYEEMLEMASSGSKVMQSRAVEFAKKFGVVFEVRNSMNENTGTIVRDEYDGMESVVVRGVSIERDQAKVTVEDVADTPGIAARLFHAIGEAGCIVDMIVQNIPHVGLADISFTLPRQSLADAEQALRPLLPELGAQASITTQTGIAKLSVVGIGMRSHSSVAARMFSALAEASINIEMISTSEIKTAVTLDEARIEEAARVVHAAFGLSR